MAQEIKAANPWANSAIHAKVTITPKMTVTIRAKRCNARRHKSRFNFVSTTGRLYEHLPPTFGRIDSVSGSIRHRVAGAAIPVSWRGVVMAEAWENPKHASRCDFAYEAAASEEAWVCGGSRLHAPSPLSRFRRQIEKLADGDHKPLGWTSLMPRRVGGLAGR
jgi:hypothetical protein